MGRLTAKGENDYYAPVPLLQESSGYEDGYPCLCKEWCDKEEYCDCCPIQEVFDKLGKIEDVYEEYNTIIQSTGIESLGKEQVADLDIRMAKKIRAVLS